MISIFWVALLAGFGGRFFDAGRQDFSSAEFGPAAFSSFLGQMVSSEHFLTIGAAVATLGFLVWLVRGGLALWKDLQPMAPDAEPRHDPKIHETYARKEDVGKVEREVHTLRKDTEDKFAEMSKASAYSRKGMYDRISGLEQSTSRLSAQNEDQSAQLTRLDGKIDKILERLPPK